MSRWAIISTITVIDAERTKLNNLLQQIATVLGITTSDNTGAAIDKANSRKTLENLAYLVSSGLASYYHSQNKQTLRNKYSYTKSEFYKLRDTELHTAVTEIFNQADPIKSLLVPFGVATTDVDNLAIANADYLSFISIPQLARGDVKAANVELEKLADQTDAVLENIDTYIRPLSLSYSMLYEAYRAARLIDDNAATHGDGPADATATVPAQTVADFVNIPDVDAQPDTPITLKNTSTNGATLQFYFADSTGLSTTVGLLLQSGEEAETTLADLGLGGNQTFFKVKNETNFPATYAVWVD